MPLLSRTVFMMCRMVARLFPVPADLALEDFVGLVGFSIRFFTTKLSPNGAFDTDGPGLVMSHHASAAALVSLTIKKRRLFFDDTF